MKMELMSSEESGHEGDEDVIIVKTLPWRSEQVEAFVQGGMHRERSFWLGFRVAP